MILCGRYTLLKDELEIRRRFELNAPIADFSISYNIAPGQQVLAIIHDGSKRRAGYLRWGLVPFWAKDEKIGYKMINARLETIHEKPSFKHLVMRKRCLIVADSFYEWKKTNSTKTPQRIHLENDQLFAFAGLWDQWKHENGSLFTCTIITKAANDFMKNIHHRMPVIVPQEKEEAWLKETFQKREDVKEFINSFSDPSFSAYAVSDYVNYAKNNDPTCIEPVTL